MRGRASKKRTFFRARSAPVTGIDVCTVHSNIAKSTHHDKLFAKIPNFVTAYFVFLRIMIPRIKGIHEGNVLEKSIFRPLYVTAYWGPPSNST